MRLARMRQAVQGGRFNKYGLKMQFEEQSATQPWRGEGGQDRQGPDMEASRSKLLA